MIEWIHSTDLILLQKVAICYDGTFKHFFPQHRLKMQPNPELGSSILSSSIATWEKQINGLYLKTVSIKTP